MARVLVTGGNGQLGQSIRALAGKFPSLSFTFTDVEDLDITCKDSLEATVGQVKPDYIVNCAAYTAVDRAEQEFEIAHKLNAVAPKLLGGIAKANNVKLIHVSTDYVFDGRAHTPYDEEYPVSPTSVYGSTKLEGERGALESGVSMVIRTSWLYSEYGHNFVKTIASKGRTLPELNVVFDQIGSPTWANDLAHCILTIVSKGKAHFSPEIFHYSNEGVCSWYDVAEIIAWQHGLNCKINAILSSQYPTPATRPHYSVLCKEKIKRVYGVEIPHWHSSLLECLGKM